MTKDSGGSGHTIVVHRVAARIIDFILFLILTAVFPRYVGPLVGLLYCLIADGFMIGPFNCQSIGKRFLGIQVVSLKRDWGANTRDSVIRNLPIGFVTFFAIIPIWGWILMILLGIPLLAIELYLMVKADKGMRLGDVMADTQVIKVHEESRVSRKSS